MCSHIYHCFLKFCMWNPVISTGIHKSFVQILLTFELVTPCCDFCDICHTSWPMSCVLPWQNQSNRNAWSHGQMLWWFGTGTLERHPEEHCTSETQGELITSLLLWASNPNVSIKILMPFFKNIFVVDDSKVCTKIQRLPAARLPGAFGLPVGWASRGLESCAWEAVRGAQGQWWSARSWSGHRGQCQTTFFQPHFSV